MLSYLPNLITLFRFVCVPVFVFCLLTYSKDSNGSLIEYLRAAQIIFIIACVSDALDGAIARHFKIKSPIGSFLDPLADKALVLSGFFTLALLTPPAIPYIPLWFAFLVFFKDFILGLGVSWARLKKMYMEVKPHWTSKISTFLQMATIISALFQMPSHWFIYMLYLSAIFIALSTLIYLFQGVQLLRIKKSSYESF